MKRCPQCDKVFDDQLGYCTHDGTPLVDERFALPSEFAATETEEDATVIRREPIVVDLAGDNAPREQSADQASASTLPPQRTDAQVVIVNRRHTGKYLLFLIVGLLLGGGLVLATLILTRGYYQGGQTPAANGSRNVAIGNREAAKSPTVKPTVQPAPEMTPDSEHFARTDVDETEFNGRVIVTNANVRTAPDKNSAQTAVLPADDRLTIVNRENEESPWFFAVCEHGTSGWMHGNTIEYVR